MKRMLSKRVLALMIKGASVVTVAAAISAVAVQAQAANMTDSLVESYAAAMKAAANSQDINRVANLVSDDALISLSRRGKMTSLNKEGYLNLLQSSWNQTSNYQYDIKITDVVTSGTQAKANISTVESWVKDGKKVNFVTNSRVTLTVATGNAVLLRAVSQVTIN